MKSAFLCTALFWLCSIVAVAQEVECGYVDVSDGGQIYYESVGQGDPVVLLHGHTLDLRMWDPQMDSLVAHYRVIRPEMRGYGHSSRMQEGQSFTHLDDMMTVLDSLHIDRAHVVGLSMGSFVASEMVALHPERIITATLVSGNIRKRPGPSTPITPAEEIESRERIASNHAQGLDSWKQEWIDQLIEQGGSNRESIRESLTQQVMNWDGWLLFNMEGRLYYADEAWDTLKVKCPTVPTLILSGENEKKAVPNAMLKYLPNGRQVVIPDCGHMSNMEQPEIFTSLLLEHFRANE